MDTSPTLLFPLELPPVLELEPPFPLLLNAELLPKAPFALLLVFVFVSEKLSGANERSLTGTGLRGSTLDERPGQAPIK